MRKAFARLGIWSETDAVNDLRFGLPNRWGREHEEN